MDTSQVAVLPIPFSPHFQRKKQKNYLGYVPFKLFLQGSVNKNFETVHTQKIKHSKISDNFENKFIKLNHFLCTFIYIYNLYLQDPIYMSFYEFCNYYLFIVNFKGFKKHELKLYHFQVTDNDENIEKFIKKKIFSHFVP